MRDTTVLTRAELTPETDAIAKEQPTTAGDYVQMLEHARDLERRVRRFTHYWGQEKECVKVLREERDGALAREERSR